MAENVRTNNWPGGIDNRSPANRLSEGFVRDMVNLDPGATLSSRVGYEKVVSTTACRAIMSFGRKILFVDGNELREMDGQSSRLLRTIAGAGPVASCVHNSELFISTENETLRYDGQTLREWGVPDVKNNPAPAITDQKDGRRRFAMTYVNQYGEEGGTTVPGTAPDGVYVFTVSSIPTGCKARIYVSSVNGQTLYLQGELSAPGDMTVYNPVDDTAALTTINQGRPRPGALMAETGGTILIASGKTIYHTEPMSPHLVSYNKAFFQYPTKIGMMLSGLHGVYVSADKCYKLDGIAGGEPRQDTVMDYPAVEGTGLTTPQGQAIWLTRYGMAKESRDPREGVGEASGAFYLGDHDKGASGFVEHDGRSRMVATAKRTGDQTGLAAADYFEAEVIRP